MYTLNALLEYTKIIGGAALTTVYIRFRSKILDRLVATIQGNLYPLEERLASIRKIYYQLFSMHPYLFYGVEGLMLDIANTSVAYCFLACDRGGLAVNCAMNEDLNSWHYLIMMCIDESLASEFSFVQ